MADTIDKTYEKYDWLFLFEADTVTHLHGDCTVYTTTVLERQERAVKKLNRLIASVAAIFLLGDWRMKDNGD